MKAPLDKKSVHFGLSLILALFGPLISLLLLSDVWRGEVEIAFYVIIGVELAVYFLLIYWISRFVFSLTRKDT
jgi:hypothetical protein